MTEIYQARDFTDREKNGKFLLQPDQLHDYFCHLNMFFDFKYFNNWPSFGPPIVEYRDRQIVDLLAEIDLALSRLDDFLMESPAPAIIELSLQIDFYGQEAGGFVLFGKEGLEKILRDLRDLTQDTIDKGLSLYFAGD